MDKILQPDTKVKYKTEDGKDARGIVHTVSTHETPGGLVTAASYQIDTGRDVSVQEFVRNKRDEEINRQLNALLAKGATIEEAHTKVLKRGDLPKDETYTVKVRQPELVTVPAEFVAPV